ncbi:MAG TPA: cytochrome c-type biogenesis protein [Usitatibacter sp.]|nr:cytochrome c-type biogenesis protein [Usitatibacter sp.]
MRRTLAAVVCAVAFGVFAQSAEVARPDAAVERRLKALGEELRCLVCQNQTIADSSAPLAVDLRNQLRAQISSGKSDDDIRAYMVQRYGDFVLYRPPLRAATFLLWIGPFALVAVGALIFILVVRRRRPVEGEPLSAQRHDELAALLEGREAQQPGARKPRRK